MTSPFKERILKLSEELGHMPSRSDLELRGLKDVSNYVQRTGGFILWAKNLNLASKLSRKWDENSFIFELSEVCRELDRFPSASDLKKIGRLDLSSQIVKRGGFVSWSDKLGFERKQSDSDTGWNGEKALKILLESKNLFCEERRGVRCSYDLLIKGNIRIDVKAANYAEYGPCKGWFYRIAKDAQADIIALYQLDTGDAYFIPWNICPKTNITISRNGGKYKDFKNRFDILENLIKLREAEQIIWPNQIAGGRSLSEEVS